MAKWNSNPTWHGTENINRGNQFQSGDGLVYSDLNKMVENTTYVYQNAITQLVMNTIDTEISITLKHNTDCTFTANNISSVHLTLDNTVAHGFISGLNFRIGSTSPNIDIINNSLYNLIIWKNGVKTDNIILNNNVNIVSTIFCDGMNVYWYIKEIQV